jgi:uncharacterized membrane protein
MSTSHFAGEPGLPNRELGLERLVFFSDAVMAIAITLLAIEIRLPQMDPSLAGNELSVRLGVLGPQIMSFVISFVVIGIYWISHHRYFSYIMRFNHRLLSLNLLFLFFIVLMPFAASLLGQYATLPLGVIIYSGEVVALGFTLGGVWWYASHHHRLIDVTLDRLTIRRMNVRALAAPLTFLAAIPLSLVSPLLGMALWWLSPLISIAAVRVAVRP